MLGIRLLHENRDQSESARSAVSSDSRRIPRGAVVGFSVASLAILVAAPAMARSGAAVAEEWGIASGFFGVVFLAGATSLPEMAVVVAALRGGSHALAVGNLLGSNCFNMFILVALDALDRDQSLLAGISPGVALSAVFASLMMGMVLLDTLKRSEHRIGRTLVTSARQHRYTAEVPLAWHWSLPEGEGRARIGNSRGTFSGHRRLGNVSRRFVAESTCQ